jgi:hypothetical protein
MAARGDLMAPMPEQTPPTRQKITLGEMRVGRTNDVCAHRRHASIEPKRRTRAFDPSRQDKHWGRRKLMRDE